MFYVVVFFPNFVSRIKHKPNTVIPTIATSGAESPHKMAVMIPAPANTFNRSLFFMVSEGGYCFRIFLYIYSISNLPRRPKWFY